MLALVLSAAVLVGCGEDEVRAPSGSESSAGEATNETATTESAEQSTVEATPAVEPATGPKLRHDLAEITMPEGWRRAESNGIPFLRTGRSPNAFGILLFTELGGADTDPAATSLDAIAKRALRLLREPHMRRVDDAVIGGDTMAYRLVGRDKYYYSEQYGVLLGNFEYVISFDFNMGSGTVKEAVAIIESIMATWDFNP